MGPRSEFFDTLADQHWAISDHMIDPDLHERLYQTCQHNWMLERFRPARTGREHTSSLNTDTRGDSICWLTAGQPGSATDDFLIWADTLSQEMNRLFYAGLNSAEFHFARYPQGKRPPNTS